MIIYYRRSFANAQDDVIRHSEVVRAGDESVSDIRLMRAPIEARRIS